MKKVNETDRLTFSIPFDNTYIDLNSCEMKVKHEFDWFIIKNVSLSSSSVRVLEVECESEFVNSKSILCTPIEIIGVSPLEMFNKIMESATDNKLNYIFKDTDLTNKRSLVIEEETSVFENLINMAKAFDCIIEFSFGSKGERYVSFRKTPYKFKKQIKKDMNLKQLNIRYDSNNLFTRILPFGANNPETGEEINILGINPTKKSYLENYEYFKAKGLTDEDIRNNAQCQAITVRRYSDITDEHDLLTVAKEELDKISKPRVTGSVNYSDLSVLEDSIILPPQIYEEIIIIDRDIKMVLTSNIIGIEWDYDNILESKITLDNVVQYSSAIKDLITNGEKIDKITGTDVTTGKPSLIAQLVKGKLEASVVSFGTMLDSIEKPEQKYAMLFENRIKGHPLFGATATGTSGLLIADELNGEGKWIWKTAISAKGINASEISTGILNAVLIKAGILQSVDGSTWINIENGTFNFANKVKYDGSNFDIDLSGKDLATNSSVDNKLTTKVGKGSEFSTEFAQSASGFDFKIGNDGTNVKLDKNGQTIRNGVLTVINGNNTVVIDGQSNMFKIHSVIDLEINAGDNLDYTQRINHGLGYIPAFCAFQVDPQGSPGRNVQLPASSISGVGLGTGLVTNGYIRAWADSSYISINYLRTGASVMSNIKCRVFIYKEALI